MRSDTRLIGVAIAFTTALSVSVASDRATPTGALSQDKDMATLATKSGCFICHSIASNPNIPVPLAPSYQDIARRYPNDEKTFEYLLDRVLHGTLYREQVWSGKVNMRFMPPNVNVHREDAAALVHWILSLDEERRGPIPPDLSEHERALALATTSGCMTCHPISPLHDVRAIPLAPSFREIAALYDGKEGAPQHLVEAVRNGTLNKPKVWQNVNMHFMPPNVALKDEDARILVKWILSLDHAGISPHAAAGEPPHRRTSPQ